MKSKGVAAVSSSPIKPIGKTGASSSLNIGVRGKASVSSGSKGKAIVSDNVGEMKVLMGLEMLLIDEEETVIQGFIPHGRIETYLRHMKAGVTYRLNKFYGSKSKTIYRDSSIRFPEDQFRIHGYKEFEAACDLRGDLYDYVGHIKLVNGQVPNDSLLLDEAEIAASRRVELHVQTHDDPVLKLYLWDKAAFEFCEKFKASGGTARVILVTTLNLKRFVGVLSLSSMTPSRVFLDSDVQETRLNSNLDVANRVNAEVVTKPETTTLGELFSYMKQASAKVAWIECTSTIDDVVHGFGLYYIGCGVCHTKATKGPTTLMCKKCGKSEIVGVAQYLSKLSIYDHNDQAVFVVLGDAVGEDHIVPVPQAMIDTIGQTRKFIVKVSNHNLSAMTQTLTVTKVLPLEAPEPEGNLGENVDEEPDNEREDHADESVKMGADGIESEGAKRAKSG
ncbi:BnaC03g47310D [Brassica napus]|uniref:BnaC03g47310D protein n=1 Tax=Brassica napus TaxID=3708 RepID=A0A078F3B8_BRANA|nr:BnaC03g47310D [Brassica napus]